jgi:dihydrofolate synthase/folylpolyglutamate synthase
MAEILSPHFSRIIITTPGTFKKSNLAGLHKIFGERTGDTTELLLIPDTAAAVKRALEDRRGPVLGTGSFYLAAEIRKHLLGGNEQAPPGTRPRP